MYTTTMQESFDRSVNKRLDDLERRLFALEMAAFERKCQGYEARIERLEKSLAEKMQANRRDSNQAC